MRNVSGELSFRVEYPISIREPKNSYDKWNASSLIWFGAVDMLPFGCHIDCVGPTVRTSEMKILGLSMTVLFAVAVPTMGADDLTAFTGRWQVAGVAVPDAGVQALKNDDPSLMGKRLTFTPQRLEWNQPTSTNDACVRPTFTRLPAEPANNLPPQLRKLGIRQPVPYALRCRSGSWGPGDKTTVYLGAAGAIAMPWYDNGVLRLIR